MSSSLIILGGLWILTLLLQLGWAVRIWRARQIRSYRAVFLYFILSTLAGAVTLVGWVIPSTGEGPQLAVVGYLIARPMIWVLFFAVVHEMFARMASKYMGLRRMGQLVLFGAVASVALWLAMTVIVQPYSAPELNRYYRLWLIQEQSVYLATALGVMATIAVGRFFQLPLSRNLRTLLGTLGVYFMCMGAMIVLRSFLGSSWNSILDTGGLVLYCACLLIGVFAFSSAGEDVDDDPRLTNAAAHRESLVIATRRLEEVNMHLVKVLAK